MNKLSIFMKRLLMFSGSKVDLISTTQDGVIFDTEFEGKRVRIFITDLADNTLIENDYHYQHHVQEALESY